MFVFPLEKVWSSEQQRKLVKILFLLLSLCEARNNLHFYSTLLAEFPYDMPHSFFLISN